MAATSTPRRLVIVESPAKARTIQGYLGKGYDVQASVGHIRDLPSSAGEVPAAIKSQPWARLGIDVEAGFQPYYVVPANKKAKVGELKKALSGADELWLATDEDREGEAIAWHLREVLKPKVPVRRMVFHEITRDAIQEAAANTRDLDQDLVDAQDARRLVDRLYGFEVSPVLWRKVMSGLSAGRVQSVATRLVVDRERARIAFHDAEYWDASGTFALPAGEFPARLASVDGARVAGGSDFGDDGQLTAAAAGAILLSQADALGLVEALADASWSVRSVAEKPTTRRPAAPFMTSTLQQEASRRFRWGAQRTMRVAQSLYENGFITYMRTDSTTLSAAALTAARLAATEVFGELLVAPAPRHYDRKVKNAQEAHEAIRPAGEVFARPAELSGRVSADEFALYDLIWTRTIASQMADAKLATTTVHLGATAADGRDAVFRASGTVTVFAGFLAAYEEWTDETREGLSEGRAADRRLPAMATGDVLDCIDLQAGGHTTTPPARYTEASLVKDLEARGIGRPSTYASIITTITERGYVRKRGPALIPTFLAFNVTRVLEKHFGVLVDYNFTARMEEVLDAVADASQARLQVLEAFFYGGKGVQFPGLSVLVAGVGDIDARALASFPVGPHGMTEDPVSGAPDQIVLRVGKYGPYLERGQDKGNVAEDLAPDELTLSLAEELLAAPSGDRSLGVHPETGLEVVARSGRYGPYVTETLPEGSPKSARPRTASLFKDMSLDTVGLTDAVRLLSLPREVGIDEEGRTITAANGRFGPYVMRTVDGKPDYRSLPGDVAEEDLFTVTLEQALALFAEPRQRRGQARAAATALRELGTDPNTQSPIVMRDGRFGPYVTDGTTNASLRKGDDPAMLTRERAIEMLAEKRAAAPAKKAPAKKAPAKKAPAKRVPKKAPATATPG